MRALTVLAGLAFDRGPRPVRTRIAGVDALVARPRGGDGPAVVYANAATPRGIEEPAVAALLRGFAAAGFVAYAPELPAVRDSELTPDAVDALVSVAGAAGPRVGLVGASTGAGLALLAAGNAALVGRVVAVTAVAPFASLRKLLCLATTGRYGGREFGASLLVARMAERSLAASAAADPAVRALLANRDPERFEALYARLAPATRALVEALSPVEHVGRITAPVELLASPDDPFFPLAEAESLVRADDRGVVRLTVSRGLDHVRPRLGFTLVPIAAALERSFRRTADSSPEPLLTPVPAL